jgi:hypothetical protein
MRHLFLDTVSEFWMRSSSASFSNERYTSGWRRIPFYPKGPDRADPQLGRQRGAGADSERASLGANPDASSTTHTRLRLRLAPHSHALAALPVGDWWACRHGQGDPARRTPPPHLPLPCLHAPPTSYLLPSHSAVRFLFKIALMKKEQCCFACSLSQRPGKALLDLP